MERYSISLIGIVYFLRNVCKRLATSLNKTLVHFC